MNDLRAARWSDPGAAINEPGSVRFQKGPLLARDLQRCSQDNPQKVINDWQSLNEL
jgi:hypothetical protein